MSYTKMVKQGFKLPKSVKNVNPILTIQVLGENYSIYLHTRRDLNRIVNDCEAFMHFGRKEVRFNEEIHDLNIIVHELIHCFIAGTYIHELTELDKSDFEEVICEVVSNNYVKLYNLAKKVKRAIKEELIKRSEENEKIRAEQIIKKEE